ncbi:MAG: hypothetical protein WCB68_23470, partial [Pyrinomonadaceae bacterium]
SLDHPPRLTFNGTPFWVKCSNDPPDLHQPTGSFDAFPDAPESKTTQGFCFPKSLFQQAVSKQGPPAS